MRLMEQRQREAQYSSSLEANLTRFNHTEQIAPKPTLGTSHMNTSNDYLDNDSKSSTPRKGSPLTIKKKIIDIVSPAVNSEKLTYDETKNPFADEEEEKNPFESKNPFEEEEEEDYDKNLNPFA